MAENGHFDKTLMILTKTQSLFFKVSHVIFYLLNVS
ncbi:hypothetical protein AAULR_01245 [Lacticaseibacillus rhamnosus MTCC 5462]|nr:hypothetical protein AAULR_01245 [Lacticaseibacillus rhamnosus MTCC 5462]